MDCTWRRWAHRAYWWRGPRLSPARTSCSPSIPTTPRWACSPPSTAASSRCARAWTCRPTSASWATRRRFSSRRSRSPRSGPFAPTPTSTGVWARIRPAPSAASFSSRLDLEPTNPPCIYDQSFFLHRICLLKKIEVLIELSFACQLCYSQLFFFGEGLGESYRSEILWSYKDP